VFSFHPFLRPFLCRASVGLVGAVAKKFSQDRRFQLAKLTLEHALNQQGKCPNSSPI